MATPNFSTVSKEAEGHGIKGMIFGASGAGKTVLAATLPNPVILAKENGLLSLSQANQMRIFGSFVDIPVIKISSVEDIKTAYEWLSDPVNSPYFESVYIDSASDLAEVVLAHYKANLKDGRQAYGETQDKMLEIIRLFKDLPGKHVFFTCAMEKDKDEATGFMLYQPSLPGKKLSEKLPYLFDEVYHLGVGKDDKGKSFRYLRTQSDSQFLAKSRSGALAEIIVPNLSAAIAQIANKTNQ